MSRQQHSLDHKFVMSVPDPLEPGILYVSVEYATAIHQCACGCGREVVTPFTPRDWQISFNGDTVTLSPSIGNWNYPCRSHYWIRNNRVVWIDECFDGQKRNKKRNGQRRKSWFDWHEWFGSSN